MCISIYLPNQEPEDLIGGVARSQTKRYISTIKRTVGLKLERG